MDWLRSKLTASSRVAREPTQKAYVPFDFEIAEHPTRATPDWVNSIVRRALVGHSATLVGGFVYVYGGLLDRKKNDYLYALDASANEWRIVPQGGTRPVPRIYGKTCVADDCLYVAGGLEVVDIQFNDFPRAKDLWKFDLVLNSWAEIVMPEPFQCDAMKWYEQGKEVLVFSSTLRALNVASLRLYEPKQVGKPKLTSPVVCADHSRGMLFVLSEYSKRSKRSWKLFTLEGHSGEFTWSEVKVACPKWRSFAGLSFIHGRLLLFGGLYPSHGPTAMIEVFDIKAKAWFTVDGENSPYRSTGDFRGCFKGAFVTLQDQVILVGGDTLDLYHGFSTLVVVSVVKTL